MIKAALLCALLVCPSAWGKWRLHKRYGPTSIHISERGTRLVAKSSATVWEESKLDKNTVSKMANKKRKMLTAIGVTDWRVDESRTDSKRGLVYLRGSYTDRNGKRVHFVEWHRYDKDGSRQLLLTNADARLLNKDDRPELLDQKF